MPQTVIAWCPKCGAQTDKAQFYTKEEFSTGEFLAFDCKGCGRTGIVSTWDKEGKW